MASLVNRAISPLILTAGFTLGGFAALTYAGTCLALYNYQRKLIFRPLPHIIRTPADIGLAYEDVWIPTTSADGSTAEKLHSWWLPNPGSRHTLLYCHGNYGNISYNLDRIRILHERGFSILVFDYRGYGQSTQHSPQPDSESVPTEKSTFADAETVWQYLTTQRQVKPAEITIFGHSMGSAIAIELASHHPEADRLIVESAFTSMEDAVHAKKMYSLFPIQQLLTEPFDSISKVSSLQLPVLYIHGNRDADVPFHMSQRLYAASTEPKQLWISTGAGHNDIAAVDGEGYKRVMESFMANTVAQEVKQSLGSAAGQRSAMSTAA